MFTRWNTRGATLPMTIIVMALLGVAVAITYMRISSERRLTSDAQAQMQAFAVAQSGLGRFLSTLPVNNKPGWADVDVTYNDLPGGTATVSLRQVRESTVTLLPAIYAITSRGVNTTAKRYSGSAAAAERTVATYALWTPAPFDLNGAFTSLAPTGVQINGTSARLSGIDRCGGAMPPIPGVASPNGAYTGHADVLSEGSPAGVAANIGTPGMGGSAEEEVEIDWAGIRAGTILPPNYLNPGTWPNAAQMAQWPVIKITNTGGEYILPGNGKGILIVEGDLRINGATPPRQWDGIVLVGGVIVGNGASNIYGAVITGLNVKVGLSIGLEDLGNGTKRYQYDSCAITRALGRIGSVQRVRNGWTDTWSSW